MIVTAEELFAIVAHQHAALKMLFAKLCETDPEYRSTREHAWEAMARGRKMIRSVTSPEFSAFGPPLAPAGITARQWFEGMAMNGMLSGRTFEWGDRVDALQIYQKACLIADEFVPTTPPEVEPAESEGGDADG